MNDGADRLLDILIDEIVASRSFAEKLWCLSTTRLQEMRRAVDAELARRTRLYEMRRAVDAELARRMQPHEDLRDERAGRT